MGRGRAKAKQVKVARQLKYSGGGTDLDRLRAEIAAEQRAANGDSAYGDAAGRYAVDDDPDYSPEDDEEDEDEDDEEDFGEYDTEDLVGQPGASASPS